MIWSCTSARQLVPDLVGIEGAVEQEGGAGFGELQHVDAFQEGELVAGDEVRLGDEVAGADRLVAEAQVGGGDGAGLLGIVNEVALGVVVGLFADDLDGVLVGADGAIRAESVEQGAHGAGSFGGVVGIVVQAGVGDVVLDADGEVVLGVGLEQFVVDALDHGGGEFLGGEPVASADDLLARCPFRRRR